MTKKTINVVVTGSRGYVGKTFVETARQRDDVDIQIYEFNTDNYTDGNLFYDDWCDWMDSVASITVDYVLHLGAISDSTYTNPDIVFANGLACKIIGRYAAHAAHKNADTETKVIYFSSCSAINPMTLYGWSKVVGESELGNMISPNNLCILRPFNIYGGDESEKRNPSIVWKFQHNKAVRVFMHCLRDFVHVDDVCAAVLSLMIEKWQHGRYELGTGKAVSMEALWSAYVDEYPPLEARPENVAEKLKARKDRMLKGFYCKRDVLDAKY